MSYWVFVFPLLAALLGWIIHWLVLQYLVNSLLPKNKTALANKLGAAVAANFSMKELKEKISGGDASKKLMPMIEGHIDHFLRNKLSKTMPVISMFIGDKTINQLKGVFMTELEELFPTVMQSYFEHLEKDIDIGQLVAAKINSIPGSELSALVKEAARPQLRQFQWLGALSGLIIGILMVVIQFVLR